jgi:RNA polymerase subunit RPABC4/transcription elongation factor Spt4
MARRECPSCALHSDSDEESCPYCGYEFPVGRAGTGIIAIILVFLMFLAFLFIF